MKRLIDISVTLSTIVLLATSMMAIAIAIRATSRVTVMFCSEGVGQHYKPFRIPKFWMMSVEALITPTKELSDSNQYITNLGRFLRRTGVNELPQLFLVISGRMSLIGPKPALTSQTDLIAKRRDAGKVVLEPSITR